MNEFKNFLTCLLGAVALMLTIAASVGAINYGMKDGSFYIVAGVCNLLGWGGVIAYHFYKRFIKKED
jgi:hypothetical protein